MMNSKAAKFNIGLIARRWYLENIQDQDTHNDLQNETAEVVTQFQQDNNNEVIVADLHIFNQLRVPETFTPDIKQCLQRKVKYAYGFGKMKKALNLALDMGCENEIIDMINGFIDRKKTIIEDTNVTNDEANFQILDPVVQKRRGRPPNKRIKSASESNSRHVSTKNSAINPIDPNLCVREVQQQSQQASSSRTPFSTLDTNTSDFHIQRHEMNENISKRKVYICKVCGQTGHKCQDM
ncbi:unnamed protein product [Rhizophagus irregularis]|nr:unnamed protein product [Rhizophagus irregularis]